MTLPAGQPPMLVLMKTPHDNRIEDSLLSQKLEFQKTIIVWWRCFQVENCLMLTTKVLKDQKIFEPLVRNFHLENNNTGDPAEAAERFVQYIHGLPISRTIKSIAALELALIKIKDPTDKNEYRISWSQSPLSLLNALILAQEYFLESENGGQYETIISNRIPERLLVREVH